MGSLSQDLYYRQQHNKLFSMIESFFSMQNLEGVEDVILCGSYGRNDGAICEDGGYYNDVDIVVVLNIFKKKNKKIRSISDGLRRFLNIKNVDILFTNRLKMMMWRRSIFLYDLKYHSKILKGKGDSLKIIREFNAREIPTCKETYILASTRVYCILKAIFFFEMCQDKTLEKIIEVNYQIAKLVIACGDALLLRNGCYVTRLNEKLRKISGFYKDEHFINTFTWAISFKKAPKEGEIVVNSAEDLNYFLELFIDFFGQFFPVTEKKNIIKVIHKKMRENCFLTALQFELFNCYYRRKDNLMREAHLKKAANYYCKINKNKKQINQFYPLLSWALKRREQP